MNSFSDFARLQLVGHTTKSTIEFDEKGKNWKLSLAGSNVSGSSDALDQVFLGRCAKNQNGFKSDIFEV